MSLFNVRENLDSNILCIKKELILLNSFDTKNVWIKWYVTFVSLSARRSKFQYGHLRSRTRTIVIKALYIKVMHRSILDLLFYANNTKRFLDYN